LAHIQNHLERRRIELSHIYEKSLTYYQTKNQLDDEIKTVVQHLQKLLVSIDQFGHIDLSLVDSWLDKLLAVDHYLFIEQTLQEGKNQLVMSLWQTLNPAYPSNGHLNEKRDSIGQAIHEEIYEMHQHTHTPSYWINQVLSHIQDNPIQLNFVENLIHHYQEVNHKDLLILTKHLLHMQEPEKLIILPVATSTHTPVLP